MRTPSRSLALVLLTVAAALSPGCVTETVPAAQPTSDVYHVTKERNGHTISLRLGQELAVVLPSIAGSASLWTPQEYDRSVLQQSSGTRTVGGSHGGMIIGGSKGYEQILFKAIRAGSTPLRLTRVRTDREGGGTVAFGINVVVSGSSR